MYLEEIELTNFRNYKQAKVQFHKRVNIITGNNAQGKTNLIESIYIMSLGKSFRTNRDTEMIGFGEDFCKSKAVFIKNKDRLDIGITISKEGKSIKIDGYKINKTIDLLEHAYMVVFSPDDMKIVKDEPEKRRKFIDRELCQLKPVYYKNLARYKKILQQRNVLLKNQDINAYHLDVWDEELADYGSRIILERKNFVEKLNKISKNISEKITNGNESLEVTYESNLDIKEDLKEQKEVFLKKLAENKKKDIYRGNTTVGPHKDDLKLCTEGIDIRNFGSQGQQRTAALSLKLAEIRLIKEETKEDPILLLDDVLSELDLTRQRFLIDSLENIQLFITTTEISPELKANLQEGYTFTVEKGSVRLV